MTETNARASDDACRHCGEQLGRPATTYYVHIATNLVMCADRKHCAEMNYPYETDREAVS